MLLRMQELIHRHWLDLILLPANILAVEAIIRQAAVNKGYTKMVSWCDHIANAVGFIQDIIVGLIQRKQPPKQGDGTMKVAGLLIAFLMFCGVASAEVTINDVLQKSGAKEGILYDVKTGHGLNFLAATVAQKGSVSFLTGLVSTDGIGAAVDYDLGKNLPVINFPVVSLVNELHVGIGGYYRTLTVHTDPVTNSKDENKWGWGPSVFVKWSF